MSGHDSLIATLGGIVALVFSACGSSAGEGAVEAVDASDSAQVELPPTDADPCEPPFLIGLMLHYDFDENLDDSSEQERHATATGAVSYLQGVRGNAISFDGGSAITIDDGLALGPTSAEERTVSFWLDTGDAGGGMVISQYRNFQPAESSFFVAYNRADGMFTVAGAGTDVVAFAVGTDLRGWHHWAVVFSAAVHSTVIYLDGLEKARGTLSINATPSPFDVVVGQLPGAQGQYLTGRLDDLIVVDHAMQPDEVASIASGCSILAPP